MRIKKPIFIIGSARSGTTILYKLLSVHSELCWFSNYSDKFPQISLLPICHKILDLPLIGSNQKKQIVNRKKYEGKFRLEPSEAPKIYHDYCGFIHHRKATHKDYNPEKAEKLKRIIKNHLIYTSRNRFISKQTANNQRLLMLEKIFPDALYIHIIREGRAVANSLYQTPWWYETEIWWLKKTVKEWVNSGTGKSIELAALHWKKDVAEIKEFAKVVKERYFELRYSELCKNTKANLIASAFVP